MKFLLSTIILLSTALFALYFGFNYLYAEPAKNDDVFWCGSQIQAFAPGYKQVILTAQASSDARFENIIKVWSDLNEWKAWADTSHIDAQWSKGNGWATSSELMQTLKLGFPLGERVLKSEVKLYQPERKIAWWDEREYYKYCQIWNIERISPSRTKINTTIIAEGDLIMLIKPFVATPWQKSLEESLKSFVTRTHTETEH